MSTLGGVIAKGADSAKGSASIAGMTYYADDTLKIYRANGTTWDDVTPSGSGSSNPMTAAGDIIIGGTAGAATRLAKSTDGKVLTLVSGSPDWATPSGGGGGGFLYAGVDAPPVLSGWTWVNQGAATAAQGPSSGAILITIPNNSSLNWRMLTQPTGSAPWKARFLFKGGITGAGGPASSQTIGIYARNSSSGKIMGMELLSQGSSYSVRINRMTNFGTDDSSPKSFSISWAQYFSVFMPMASEVVWQIRNDGTSIYFDYSLDGELFVPWYNETLATFISSADQVGFGGVSITTTPADGCLISLLGFRTASNATL